MKTKHLSKEKASLKKILLNDYISFLSWLFPVILFGMALFIELFGFFPDLKRGRTPLGIEAIPFFVQFGLIALAIGIILILIRINYVKKYFNEGTELNGEITRIRKFRDRGRVYFSYTLKNQEWENSMAVHFQGIVKTFIPKRKIKVLVKDNNPNKVIIKDLFVKG